MSSWHRSNQSLLFRAFYVKIGSLGFRRRKAIYEQSSNPSSVFLVFYAKKRLLCIGDQKYGAFDEFFVDSKKKQLNIVSTYNKKLILRRAEIVFR